MSMKSYCVSKVTFWVPCPLLFSQQQQQKTMFGSLLPPVVCRRAHVFFYVICVYLRVVVSNTYCVVFFFRFSWFWVRYIASCAGLSIFCSLYCSRLLLLKTKRDDFNYVIMHLSHLNSNISTAFAYAVKILR